MIFTTSRLLLVLVLAFSFRAGAITEKDKIPTPLPTLTGIPKWPTPTPVPECPPPAKKDGKDLSNFTRECRDIRMPDKAWCCTPESSCMVSREATGGCCDAGTKPCNDGKNGLAGCCAAHLSCAPDPNQTGKTFCTSCKVKQGETFCASGVCCAAGETCFPSAPKGQQCQKRAACNPEKEIYCKDETESWCCGGNTKACGRHKPNCCPTNQPRVCPTGGCCGQNQYCTSLATEKDPIGSKCCTVGQPSCRRSTKYPGPDAGQLYCCPQGSLCGTNRLVQTPEGLVAEDCVSDNCRDRASDRCEGKSGCYVDGGGRCKPKNCRGKVDCSGVDPVFCLDYEGCEMKGKVCGEVGCAPANVCSSTTGKIEDWHTSMAKCEQVWGCVWQDIHGRCFPKEGVSEAAAQACGKKKTIFACERGAVPTSQNCRWVPGKGSCITSQAAEETETASLTLPTVEEAYAILLGEPFGAPKSGACN